MADGRWIFAALLVLAVSAGLTSAVFDVVEHQKCGCAYRFGAQSPTEMTNGGEFSQIRIEPCPQLPCHFKKGKPLKLEVDFVAAESFQKLEMKLRGELSNKFSIGGRQLVD
ncbi:hypothetical protein MTO96_003847 [Rhipicephalus appendiculatus]